MKFITNILAPCFIASVIAPNAIAAVLIFKNDVGGGFANDNPVVANYGDNIATAVQDGFSYGTTGGFTPDVLVSYSGEAIYNSDYGDLGSVVYATGPTLTITFTATVGTVSLDSFDMAAFTGSPNQTIPTITVSNGLTTYAQTGLVAPVAGRSSVNFTGNPSAAAGATVTLTIAGAENGLSGFSNFQFSQIPEPASGGLLGMGALALMIRRRQRVLR